MFVWRIQSARSLPNEITILFLFHYSFPGILETRSNIVRDKRCRHHFFAFQLQTNYVMAKKYGKKAQSSVKSAMKRRKRGTLKSGSGRKVTSKKQAIAIGLSEARKKGAKVPKKKTAKKATKRKTGTAAKKRSPAKKTRKRSSRS